MNFRDAIGDNSRTLTRMTHRAAFLDDDQHPDTTRTNTAGCCLPLTNLLPACRIGKSSAPPNA